MILLYDMTLQQQYQDMRTSSQADFMARMNYHVFAFEHVIAKWYMWKKLWFSGTFISWEIKHGFNGIIYNFTTGLLFMLKIHISTQAFSFRAFDWLVFPHPTLFGNEY